jgi:hypothetical protein
MTQKLRFAEARLAETSLKSPGTSEDRLPVGAAMTAIVGANMALWFLIAVALRNLF